MPSKVGNQTPIVSLNKAKEMYKVQSPSTAFAKTTRSWFLASALYDGVEDEDLKQIKTLLEDKGADPNMLLPEYGITPFHLIVGNSCKAFALKATRLCLLAGADPNVRSEEGLTPVHVTAIWGRVEVLELLLKHGGDPWLVDDEKKKNAFQYAQEENQWGAFNLMATYCSLEKISDHQKEVLSPSPCTFELKRVLVYKNDLCVEYEATATEKTKSNNNAISVQTMTTPRLLDCKSVSVQTPTRPQLQHKPLKQILECHSEAEKYKACTCQDDIEKFDWCKEQNGAYPSDQACQIINNHRKNTVIYESLPKKIVSSKQEEQNYPQGSWRRSDCYNNTDFKLNLVTELRNKLEDTNKVRLFYECNDVQNSQALKNVTLRNSSQLNIRVQSEKPNSFQNSERNGDNVIDEKKKSSNQNIGLNIDKDQLPSDEHTTSDAYSKENAPDIRNECSSDEMNFGFICDPNSLISDISSDIETMPQVVDENIMTEDECHEEIIVSSSTSNLYITCDEEYSSKNNNDGSFLLPETIDKMVISEIAPFDDEVEDEIEMINSEENLVSSGLQRNTTSTPNMSNEPIPQEEESDCSTNAVSGSPCTGKEYQQQLNGKMWVEAHIPYTSDEEEQEMSISEEYKYTDTEEGVVLIEKRYLFDDVSIPVTPRATASTNDRKTQQATDESDISSLSRNTSTYDTDALRKELHEKGFIPGPITGNTKRIYLRRLKRYKRKPHPIPEVNIPTYSCELSKTLTAVNLTQLLTDWSHLERDMCSVFESANPSASWREGFAKTSFTYLLLDPRVTRNLPARALSLPCNEVWSDFLQSVFYIGKGKRSRPYCHLYQAVSVWENKRNDKSAKVERILEIWRSGLGVVCLHVFQNIIPVEAYTREAAMIAALSLDRLTNEKSGEYYGPASSWLQRQKRYLGIILLHRAYQVFIAEGERQLRPGDID